MTDRRPTAPRLSPLVRPLGRLLLRLLVLSLSISVVLLGAVLFAPAQTLGLLLKQGAERQGVTLLSSTIDSPWSRSADNGGGWAFTLASFALEIDGSVVEVSNATAGFTLTGLVRGQLASLTLGDVTVSLSAAQPAADSIPAEQEAALVRNLSLENQLSPYLELFEEERARLQALPIGSWHIRSASLELAPETRRRIEAQYDVRLAAVALEALKSDDSEITVNAAASGGLRGEPAALHGTLTLSPSPSSQPRASLSLTAALTGEETGSITLDAELAADEVTAALHADTPLVLTLLPVSVSEAFEALGVSELALDATLSAQCARLAGCDGEAAIRLNFEAPSVQVTAQLPATFSLAETADIAFDIAEGSVRFSVWADDSSHASGELSVQSLRAQLGRSNSLSARFASGELSVALAGAQLIDPSLTGSSRIDENEASLVWELGLAGTPFAGTSLVHSFDRDTGSIDLRVEPPAFDAQRPLSSLVDYSQLTTSGSGFDLVAGRVRLRADIAWSQQDQGQWATGGPVVLKLESLSGFYGETLFLGARSDHFAELTPQRSLYPALDPAIEESLEEALPWTLPWTLESVRSSPLEIASIDSGLRVENASMDYRFRLSPFEEQSISAELGNIRAGFLGGQLSIPRLLLGVDSSREQRLDLVLSGVDLGSIVSLADYPEVSVDGLVSGYLPLTLRMNASEAQSPLVVTEGLISALKPGGSIRYSPLGGVSSNQSIQLVNEALANYQFSTLDTTLEVEEDGAMSLGVALAGRNPDMNGGQAINLNVSISDNLLDLVRSLRASRDLTEELEKRVND